MKRLKSIITIIICLQSLCIRAQAFSLDHSFNPFLDIRNEPSVAISGFIEENDSRVYLSGTFSVQHSNFPFDGMVCYYRNGNLFSNYSFSRAGLGIITDIGKISQNFYYASFNGTTIFYDSLGKNSPNNNPWVTNYAKTVSCKTGKPFFFTDGSSLFANGFIGTPCPIINPPDTFPGRFIVKVNPQGNWDSTFNHDANAAPTGFIPYDSNRILIYGIPNRFQYYDSTRVDGLCRIFLDGTLDTSFHSPLLDTNAFTVAEPRYVDPEGKIFLIGRYFIKNGGGSYRTLIRLNSDGSLDSSFMNNAGPTHSNFSSSFTYTVSQTSDKGYLVGGSFTNYQGFAKRNIAKIDSSGRVEPQYFTGQGPDSSYALGTNGATVFIIKKSKFGGYYVGGDFLKWDGQPSQPIVRLYGLNAAVGLIEKKQEKEKVLVYPNPFQENITVQLADFHSDYNYRYQIKELSGKGIDEGVLFAPKQTISLARAANGSYLFILLVNGQQSEQKLIIKQ